ncbi:receptor-transporting protein 5 isoform X1 [Sorex araneus]|uniref:receptor-transporting protein 5 isoform X1 n=1 Tax=Sorex araneus TaxID=42254 RepID=UPI00033164A1|nr:receptor-transporting protein 5 isoform X1 [Sorex araneus]
MDGADLWASTLAQLMAMRKPFDTWELLPDEDLVAGQVEGNGHQYRLRGLSRFECGHCQWGWGSAHVHILFHLWWNEGQHLGLVKMRVWGQHCRVCPPGDVGPCRVSLLNVRLFLGKLVLYILHKCYREGPDTQYPEVGFGEHCEACDKGVCFFLKPRDPDWGPEAKPRSVQGTYKLFSDENGWDRPGHQQLLALGSGTLVERIWGDPPNTIPLPFSVADFIRSPLANCRNLINDDDIVTVPFSLEGVGSVRGPFACALPEGSTLGKGSIYLPNSMKLGKGQHIAVTICEPVFQGRGILFNSRARNFKGFIFKGHGALTSSHETDSVQGRVRRQPQGMSYIVGFMDSGEGSVTFPLSLATLVTGKDPFTYNDGSVTFPFIYTDDAYNKDTLEDRASGRGGCRRQGGRGCGPHPGPEQNGELPGALNKGSISLPFSIFTLIKRTGPQSSRLFHRYYRRQRQRSWGDSWGWGYPHTDDFCCLAGCCESTSGSNDDLWILVSTIFFILWVIYLHKTSPDRYLDM